MERAAGRSSVCGLCCIWQKQRQQFGHMRGDAYLRVAVPAIAAPIVNHAAQTNRDKPNDLMSRFVGPEGPDGLTGLDHLFRPSENVRTVTLRIISNTHADHSKQGEGYRS